MGYWPYDRIFSKYKQDCEIFFETGTHKGDSCNDALNLGFNKIISVEIDPKYYNECVEKFKNELNSKVFLFLGDSANIMGEMLKLVDKRAMFWLDAHGNGGGSPFKVELEHIFNHHIKNHIIVIDDLGDYGCDEEYIKHKILSFNSNYKFDTDWCAARQLIAYID